MKLHKFTIIIASAFTLFWIGINTIGTTTAYVVHYERFGPTVHYKYRGLPETVSGAFTYTGDSTPIAATHEFIEKALPNLKTQKITSGISLCLAIILLSELFIRLINRKKNPNVTSLLILAFVMI